ncbi:Serralysin-like metalloprotease C-terminal protein [Dioscorea alata]|uniref:Serralysin-like metalloprotease C-terminal protein n=1 Tax=Dioscorea alata TaxID=55571 RepID=A0ACB7WDL1_DIOAL|nr:Serralysin-like metalloprotease C-terminal protein [Dioscorea alata]
MARSSRHKSHRQHRDRSSREGRDRSESEDEERDSRVEEVVVASKTRVSRDSEAGKRKSSGRDLSGPGDDEFVEEHGRKRKDRGEDSGRWNGGDEDDGMVDKSLQNEEIGDLEREKTAKSTVLLVDSATKSSRRVEGSVERNEDSSGRRRPEKDSSRRESSSQHRETKEKGKERRPDEDLSRRGNSSHYRDAKERDSERRSADDSSRRESSSHYKKDGKERDKDQRSEEDMSWRESINQYKDSKDRDRERRSERDSKKIPDTGHEKYDDVANRKQSNTKEKQKDNDDSDWQIRDDLQNPELEKELEKRRRRRDGSGDKEKWIGDDRDNDDRRLFSKDEQLSSRDDRTKNGSYKDERHRDRHRGDYDRDHRRHDDKYRDEHSSRSHPRDRSESKHLREDKILEGQYKKSKLQNSDLDGSSYIDERETKFKDKRERKRVSDETEDYSDLKPRNAKEPRVDRERASSGSRKVDAQIDGNRFDHTHSDNSRRKGSPSSNPYGAKDRSRHIQRQQERGSPSGERLHVGTTSTGDHGGFSGHRSRDSEPQPSGKHKLNDDIHSSELLLESAPASQNDQTPRSDTHPSPVHSIEKSPSTSDWRSSDRNDLRSGREIQKAGQRNAASKDAKDFSLEDRAFELPSEKLIMENYSRTDTYSRELASGGQSSFQRTGHQPSHLPPPPPVRHGVDSPSVLGSYEDDVRVQSGDRKSGRYRRSADPGMARAHGNAWKATSTWPSPAANGFIPLQPPPTAFHPNVQQFPNQPLFSVRPSIDLHHSGVPYNIHDATDRFSGHVRPFGWHNPVGDSCPPHMQVWDGNNGMFPDETHVYGRSEWDQNRHMIENRGWEWKAQHGSMNVEFPAPQKESEYPAHSLGEETWVGQSGNWLPNDQTELERGQSEAIGGKQQNGTHPIKTSVDAAPKALPQKTAETSKSLSVLQSSKTSNEDTMGLCRSYISKLDISANLTCSELYEQCISLLEKRDEISEIKVFKHLQPEDNKAAAKTQNYMLNAFFPKVPETICQRAMSLYKKQIEGAKLKKPVVPLVFSADSKDSAEASDAEKVPVTENVDEGVHNQIPPDAEKIPVTEKVDDEGVCNQNHPDVEKIPVTEKVEGVYNQISPTEKSPDVGETNSVFNKTFSSDTIVASTLSACEMKEDNNASAGSEGDFIIVDANEASGVIVDGVDANEPSSVTSIIGDAANANEPSTVIGDAADANEPSGIIGDAADANEPSSVIGAAIDVDEQSSAIGGTVVADEPSGAIADTVVTDEPSGAKGDAVVTDEPSGAIGDAVNVEEPSRPVGDAVNVEEPSRPVGDAINADELSNITGEAVNANEPADILPDAVYVNEPSGTIGDGVDANELADTVPSAVVEPSGVKPDIDEPLLREGSESCEVIMQECREISNRIHDPPESTH